jgi:hypothetical protein
MAETLKTFASLLRSLVTLVLLAVLGVGGWIGYETINARSRLEAEVEKGRVEIEKLTGKVAAQEKQIEELDLSLRLLKRDHRLAEIRVLDQWESPDDKKQMTKFEFVEIDDDHQPIDKPRVFTIEGDVVYVDAWIVKYLDRFVERGDPIRGTSICLFKRLFGEHQEPSNGFVLDTVGSRPAAYNRAGAIPEFEREIWKQFWDFANDPAKAEQAGIRAAHPEAPSVKLRPGKEYIVELRASGGLSITPKDARPADADQL